MSSQRETYQLPSQRSSSTDAAAQPAEGAAAATLILGPGVNRAQDVVYICGECAAKVALNLGDAIRCKECGHRVLYKERTKRIVQFEAR